MPKGDPAGYLPNVKKARKAKTGVSDVRGDAGYTTRSARRKTPMSKLTNDQRVVARVPMGFKRFRKNGLRGPDLPRHNFD